MPSLCDTAPIETSQPVRENLEGYDNGVEGMSPSGAGTEEDRA